MIDERSPRQDLIETAAQLFHQRGYHAVGVSELCRAADVRKGSFYHFFDSKEALAGAAIEHQRLGTIREVLEPAFANDVPPADRIRRYFDMLATFNANGLIETDTLLGCPFGNMAAEVGDDEALIADAVAAAFDSIRSFFSSCLADANDAGETLDVDAGADALLAYMEGVILLAKARRAPDDIRRLGELAPAVVGLS